MSKVGQAQQQQAQQPKTCIRYPSSNEVVYRETDCMIVWEYSAADSPMAPPAVDIELQRAKDGTPVRTIAQRVRNQGSFFWSVSQNVPTGGPFRLFVGNMFLSSPHETAVQKNGPNAIYSAPFFIKKDQQPFVAAEPVSSSASISTTTFASSAAAAAAAQKKAAFVASSTSVIDSLSLDDAMATLSLDDEDVYVNRKKPSREKTTTATLATTTTTTTTTTGEKLCGKKRDCHSMVVTTSEDDSEPPASGTISASTKSATKGSTTKVAASDVAAAATSATAAAGKKRVARVRAAGTTGASSFALDASGSGGGGGYTAASSNNNTLTEQDKEQLCAYIYSRVQIPASAVRRNLKEIVAGNSITPDTVLSTGMRAGHFCVYYLLQRYYKKQLARSNATLERQIEKENHRTADVTDALKAFLKVPKNFRGSGTQRPSPPLPTPNRLAGKGNTAGSGSSNSNNSAVPPVLFGGDGEPSNNSGSGSGEREDVLFCRDDWSLSNSSNGALLRKEMSACVEGVSIRLEREYLQRIRCWSLNVDCNTLVDIELQLTAEQFALQYVQTDRRKRIENTRRSKDRRKQREDGESAIADDNDNESDGDAMDCDGGGGGQEDKHMVAPQSTPPPHLVNVNNSFSEPIAPCRAARKPPVAAAAAALQEKKTSPAEAMMRPRRSTRNASAL